MQPVAPGRLRQQCDPLARIALGPREQRSAVSPPPVLFQQDLSDTQTGSPGRRRHRVACQCGFGAWRYRDLEAKFLANKRACVGKRRVAGVVR